MSKIKNNERMDTVSSGSVRIITEGEQRISSFDYMAFCKAVFKMSKKNVDACFLVPLKLYHDIKKDQDAMLPHLEEWFGIFQEKVKVGNKKKGEECISFWVHLAYNEGYDEFEAQGPWDRLDTNVLSSVNDLMKEVSKLEKNQYVKQLWEDRDEAEYWILKVYEFSLKKIYPRPQVIGLIKKIIEYLRECNIPVDMPTIAETSQDENHVYQSAAMLLLLVMRLRVNIPENNVITWYRKGNFAFSGGRDRMLEEYMRLVKQYFYQSYERFIKMRELAKENKYAAKEVGDIYWLGMLFQDTHGNRILLEPDKEKACDYYRWAGEYDYIPAIVPAIKTGSMISEKQKEEKLGNAMCERNPEALAYCVEKCMGDAEACVHKDFSKAMEYVKKAVNAMLLLDEGYGEKYVLKNKLLLSGVYKICREKSKEISKELGEALENLYSTDIWKLEEDEFRTEAEKNYGLAGQYGYFEAEYHMGMLFQEVDQEKSEAYFEAGKKKGCKWCKFECARMLKEQKPKEWMLEMLSLGKSIDFEEHELRRGVAKEWADCGNLIEQLTSNEFSLNEIELLECYLQIEEAIKVLWEVQDKELIPVLGKLQEYQKKLKRIIAGGNLKAET